MTVIIILWLLIFLLSILLIKQLNINKNMFFCILISILIILFTVNINTCIPAALNGFQLWYKAILPTTFPFVIICNLLISYNGIDLYSKILGPLICRPLGLSKSCSFPIVASMLCGYPLGAKYCTDVYNMGYIEKDEYERLLNIASNVGPLFLVGSVGAALLNNVCLGYIMLVSSYLSCFAIGLITKKKKDILHESNLPSFKNTTLNFGTAIKSAVENAINTVLSIGGFIVIFSVIISLIKKSNCIYYLFNNLENFTHSTSETLYGIFLGSIEITNGCNIISNLPMSIPLKVSIISFLCSFSGLAIIAQVSSFVSESNIRYSKYILFKLIQGIFSFFITYIFTLIIPTSIYTSKTYTTLLNPYLFILPVILLLVLTFAFSLIYKLLFHIS
ncbi:MAG: sporulation integral membrane protein YlbJ [Clostridium butyricum]|nr:sporulation integral membrane protein YlbJ [Clostridium butyricum]